MKHTRQLNEVLPALCDAELFERFLAGEKSAFTTLYHRYAARVMGYIRSLLGAENQAGNDIFQETFLRLYREKNRIDENRQSSLTNVGGWLFRVARNLSLNQLRSESYLTEIPLEYTPQLVTTTSEAYPTLFGKHQEEEELLHKALKAVEELPISLREVFVLREVNGMSYEETSELIGCSIEAARMRLSRARSTIRSTLMPDTETTRNRTSRS
ncbi:MAG: RNA polymerase sigma factor [Chlorobi bacterium]|nr:RNA polymerase sigma factor [Chlorobiota bacterium]